MADDWNVGRKRQRTVALVLATYGTGCHLCGQAGADSADHVVPRSKGGPLWDLDNLRPAHLSCNKARGALDLDEWFTRHPLPDPDRPPLAPSRKWT